MASHSQLPISSAASLSLSLPATESERSSSVKPLKYRDLKRKQKTNAFSVQHPTFNLVLSKLRLPILLQNSLIVLYIDKVFQLYHFSPSHQVF